MIQRRDMNNPAAPAPLVQEAAGVVPAPGNVEQSQQVVQQAPQQQNVVQPQQPVNVFSGGSGQPTTFENMPVTVGWTPTGKPVYEGSKAQQSWQTTNPKNTEGRMPAAYALNSKPLGGVDLGGVDLGAVGGDKGVTAVFERDDSQRDGGFFKWLGGLVKNRPGRRPGESDDEYDERMTRNNMRIATLADAIRHMGNIYNTMKGGPAQHFNSPASAYFEQGLMQRKAERKAKAAAEAAAAYKNALLNMKRDDAAADRAYKNLALGIRGKAQELAEGKFEHQKGKDEHNAKLADDKFAHQKKQDEVKNNQAAQRIAILAKRAAKSGSGRKGKTSGRKGKTSGGKYWFVDKEGKIRYQPNKTMHEEEFYKEYERSPFEEESTSTTKETYTKGGKVTTTKRSKGASFTKRAAVAQNEAQAKRKKGWASGFKL